MAQKKRSETTLTTKLFYLSMATEHMATTSLKTRTDIIGLACQFSSYPKLKREDFKDIVSMKISDIIKIVEVDYKLKMKKK